MHDENDNEKEKIKQKKASIINVDVFRDIMTVALIFKMGHVIFQMHIFIRHLCLIKLLIKEKYKYQYEVWY
jgi:hypothetical protein